MSPDWAARPATVPYAVFGDPQSLNLYGYVRDDPVSRADADGHFLTASLEGSNNIPAGNECGADAACVLQQYQAEQSMLSSELAETAADIPQLFDILDQAQTAQQQSDQVQPLPTKPPDSGKTVTLALQPTAWTEGPVGPVSNFDVVSVNPANGQTEATNGKSFKMEQYEKEEGKDKDYKLKATWSGNKVEDWLSPDPSRVVHQYYRVNGKQVPVIWRTEKGRPTVSWGVRIDVAHERPSRHPDAGP